MQTIEQIKTAIKLLSLREYIQLKNWLLEKDWEKWDKKIIKDSKTGKLDFLIKEALN